MRPFGGRKSGMSDFVPPESRRQFLKMRMSSEVSDIPPPSDGDDLRNRFIRRGDGLGVIVIGICRRVVVIVDFVVCLFVNLSSSSA